MGSHKWYEKTVQKKNKIALLRQEVEDANKDFRDTNEALRKLQLAKEDLKGHEDIESKLENYYEPSDEMKMYMNVVIFFRIWNYRSYIVCQRFLRERRIIFPPPPPSFSLPVCGTGFSSSSFCCDRMIFTLFTSSFTPNFMSFVANVK